MKTIRLITAVGIAALLSACAPRAAYVGPVGTFSTQSEKLGGVVNTELARFNSDRRAAYLRHDVFRRIQRDVIGDGQRYTLSPITEYLCKPHEKASEPKDNSRYLAEVSSALNSVAETPNKETVKLLGSLFKSYDIKVKAPSGAVTNAQCVDDIDKYAVSLFPSERQEFSVGGLVEGGKQLWEVFGTLANAALQQIDEGRRAAALRAYFSNKDNVKYLRNSITNNVTFLSAAYAERRYLDVYAARRAHDALETNLAALDLQSIESCRAFLAAPGERPISKSLGFQHCAASIWSEIEPDASALLSAAASYDENAGASPDEAGKELNKTLDKLQNLAAGKLNAQEMGLMLEALANAGAAIETMIKKANDEETKKTVDEALKKIKDSI